MLVPKPLRPQRRLCRTLLTAVTVAGLLAWPTGCVGAFGQDDDGDGDTGETGDVGDDTGCGPATATVEWVIDGDTISLVETEENVRYILVGAPEIEHDDGNGGTTTAECYGDAAKQRNIELVAGQTVSLTYDAECHDKYGRLLAYIEVDGVDVNRQLIAEGLACVFQVLPNGTERVDDYRAARDAAIAANLGLWSVCPDVCQ